MAEETIESPELPEFILGTLSTKEGRLKRARIGRIGFYHDSALDPPDPKAGEPVTISVRVGAEIAVESVKLHYTTDSSFGGVVGSRPPSGGKFWSRRRWESPDSG